MKSKYLRIKLVGHDFVTAFKNENKEGNQPDYKADGVGVWINTYEKQENKEKEPQQKEELIEDV